MKIEKIKMPIAPDGMITEVRVVTYEGGDVAHVNADHPSITEWLSEEGNDVEDADSLPGSDAPPDLSPRQWSMLLDASGSRAVLEGVLDSMPKGTPEEKLAWAQIKATALNSGRYTWATTERLIAGLREQGVKGIPPDDELLSYWMIASSDAGL